MPRKTVLHVAGARPNFVKIAPLLEAMRPCEGLRPLLVHTGQHYSPELSETFFSEMALPQPDFFLGVGSGSHAEQTARIMLAFDEVMNQCAPDAVLVVGDVNSTLACALVAAKRGVPVAHVEAGLRSFDRTMPEELNRLVTDQLADFLFAPSPDAVAQLHREGVAADRIYEVGNVMIDTLMRYREVARARRTWERWGLSPGGYAVLTLHRPGTVDDPRVLAEVWRAVEQVQRSIPVVFPVHPRTAARLKAMGGDPAQVRWPQLHLSEPLGYLDFLGLLEQCAFALTDSGGVQEETTVLGVPCLTLRPATERPITVLEGTNTLVGTQADRIVAAAQQALQGPPKTGRVPALWDGQTAGRIVRVLERTLAPAAGALVG